MSKKGVKKQFTIPDEVKPFGKGYNVLMIMADEFRFPIHKHAGGMIKDLKNILGFQNVDEDREKSVKISRRAKKLFPGFMKLRENAVSLQNHTVATTACVPSRAALFTGQYGSKNTVTQTDGVFKSASDPDFNWLKEDGLPTIGDWFQANHYSTHYFGKCHFAHPDKPTLEKFGFDNWETSFPEPHGTMRNNLGMYRDPGFTDLVTTFIRRKGMALDYDQKVGKIEQHLDKEDQEEAIKNIKIKPWFAVVSFTNPHDITTWPVLPSQAVGDGQESQEEINLKEKPLGIPAKHTRSAPPKAGTWTFDMNPGGIDDTFSIKPITLNEDLKEKPDCQYDYSIKLGIALASKTGSQLKANNSGPFTGLPLALAPDPEVWAKAYMEYYTYLHHVLDQQIERVLKTLDDSGLRDNTIVMFVPDHGEYGGSHGMLMQKWHTAYQEAIHVPVVISMPNQKSEDDDEPTQIKELTSHIDLAPTLLGLVGVKKKEIPVLSNRITRKTKKVALDFVGADLSGIIKGSKSKISDQFKLNGSRTRDAILFTTSDMITEPVARRKGNKHVTEKDDHDFGIYEKAVKKNKKKHNLLRLRKGSVVQPAEVHCIRQRNDDDGDWKLVRYRDFHNPLDAKKFQWELYNLEADPSESLNLLKHKVIDALNDPFVANESALRSPLNKLTPQQIEAKAAELNESLKQLVKDMT